MTYGIASTSLVSRSGVDTAHTLYVLNMYMYSVCVVLVIKHATADMKHVQHTQAYLLNVVLIHVHHIVHRKMANTSSQYSVE